MAITVRIIHSLFISMYSAKWVQFTEDITITLWEMKTTFFCIVETAHVHDDHWKPEVSDETGALLVYSCFITYKSFSHRPTSIEHAELLGMWRRVNPECMFFKNFRGKLFDNGKRYAKSEITIQKALQERIPNHILHVQFERNTSVSQSNLLYP